jgi:hypothetical protein
VLGLAWPLEVLSTGVVYREPSTYEAMIRAELSVGSREGAEEVLRMMEARRYPVAVFMRARYLLDDPSVSLIDGPLETRHWRQLQQASNSGDLDAANQVTRNETFAPNPTDGSRRESVAYDSNAKPEAKVDGPLLSEEEKAGSQ